MASIKAAVLCVEELGMLVMISLGLENVVASVRGWENTETTSGLEMASDCDCDQLTSILGPRELEATWSRELRGCDPNTDSRERGTG